MRAVSVKKNNNINNCRFFCRNDYEKISSPVREIADVPRLNGGPIKAPPQTTQYDSAVMIREVSGGVQNVAHIHLIAVVFPNWIYRHDKRKENFIPGACVQLLRYFFFKANNR